MARNGSTGAYSRVSGPYTYNTTIDQVEVNAELDDIATALTNSLTKNGETTATANQPMGTYRHTGVGNGVARTDYAAMGQLQDGTANWIDGGGTADAITATYAPAITALVDGQICCVRATAANATTTPTFAPNGLTARTITLNGGQALVAGNIYGAGHELILRYKLAGTSWELLNPNVISITGNAATATTADTATTATNLFAGTADAVTTVAGGFAMRARAPAGDATPALIQFVNNAGTVEWGVISATGAGIAIAATTASASSSYSLNGKLLASATEPTIASGFGTSPSISNINGTATFMITIGSGGTASNGTINMPAAPNGWTCSITDMTVQANQRTIMWSSSSTQLLIQSVKNDLAEAIAWTAGKQIIIHAIPY